MDELKRLALGVCVLCVVGGVIRIFWPDNSYKPVINTVLVLYIVTSVLQMRFDWHGALPELWQSGTASSSAEIEYEQYAGQLVMESSVHALSALLEEAGIPARMRMESGICLVTLAHSEDAGRAADILDANCGELPYKLQTGGDAQ